jgi:methionyl-tRNA formyltransferase
MDEGMDTGEIVAQAPIEVPDGISYAELEDRCAVRGGELLAQTVWQLHQRDVKRVPQEEAKSSYFPLPTDEDFVVPVAEWSARRLYNFICGVTSWGGPVTLHVGDAYIPVQAAISYSHENINPLHYQGVIPVGNEELRVRCQDGWVHVRCQHN